MLKTAEDKKVKVRKTITTLRSKFKKLKVVNKDLPIHLALGADVSWKATVCVYITFIIQDLQIKILITSM